MTRLLLGTALCIGIIAILGLNSPVSAEYAGISLHTKQIEESSPLVNAPEALLSFYDQGTALFESLSAQNIGRRLAIVMDDKVLVAPTIQHKISGGKLVIMGNFTIEKAADLSLGLRSAALPRPLTMLESRVIAPAAGKGVGS